MSDCSHLFTTPEGAKRCVEQYGVAIVPGVLSESECEAMKSGMWDYFEQVSSQWPTPVDRTDPETHAGLSANLWMKHNMLMQHFGIGHAQFLWDIRQNPSVAGVFGNLWDCDARDLTVSFDGAAYNPPPETRGGRGFQKTPWYHCDQSVVSRAKETKTNATKVNATGTNVTGTKETGTKTQSDMSCVQGWVTAYDVNHGDASLVVMEGSHRHFDDMCVKYNIQKNGDWYKLESANVGNDYAALGCTERRIVCPAGSLVLWDSRTLHYGGNAVRGRAEPNHRLVGYVCYLPASKLTAANRKKKRLYFDTQRTIGHDPCNIRVFSVNPRTYGKEVLPMTPLPVPVLTELGQRLV